MKYSLSGLVTILFIFLSYQNNSAQYGPIDKLLTEIRDSNKRPSANEKLQKLKDKKIIPFLIEGLKDSNDFAQADCASALGNFKDTTAVNPLLKLLRKSGHNYVKSMCAEALGKLNDERAIEPLINEVLLGIRSVYVAKAIASFGNRSSKALINNIIKSDGKIKSELLEAFRYMSDKELMITFRDTMYMNQIIELLNNKDDAVRIKSVDILGAAQNPVVVKPLLKIMHDNKLSYSVYNALNNYDNVEITDSMLTVISRFSDKKKLGEPPSINFYNNKNELSTAIKAISNRKDNRIEDVLIKALEENDQSMHVLIAESLVGFISNKSAISIIKALENDSENIRKNISFIYRSTKNAEIKKYFEAAWKNKDLPIIAGAYEYFLKKRISGDESLWLDILSRYANEGMATAFINSGNKKLETEARKWAARHGYFIVPTFKKK